MIEKAKSFVGNQRLRPGPAKAGRGLAVKLISFMHYITDKAVEAFFAIREVKTAVTLDFMSQFSVSAPTTIFKWFKDKNIILTTPDAVKIIAQHTGIPEAEVIVFDPLKLTV